MYKITTERAQLRALLLLTCRSCIEITSFISVGCLPVPIVSGKYPSFGNEKFQIVSIETNPVTKSTTDGATSRYASLQSHKDGEFHNALSEDVTRYWYYHAFCHSLILILRFFTFIRLQILLRIDLHLNTYLQREIEKLKIKSGGKYLKNGNKPFVLDFTFAGPWLFIYLSKYNWLI